MSFLSLFRIANLNFNTRAFSGERTLRKGIFALTGLLFLSPVVLGQHRFDHLHYLMPRLEGQKKGDPSVKGSVVFDGTRKAVEFLNEKGDPITEISTANITGMSVEQKTPRNPFQRVPDKYLLTIRYTDTEGTRRFVAITLDKHNRRAVLSAAVAETGKEVFHIDRCCPL